MKRPAVLIYTAAHDRVSSPLTAEVLACLYRLQYFLAKGSLAGDYWSGLVRASVELDGSSTWALPGGAPLPSGPSNTKPCG